MAENKEIHTVYNESAIDDSTYFNCFEKIIFHPREATRSGFLVETNCHKKLAIIIHKKTHSRNPEIYGINQLIVVRRLNQLK